MRERTAVFVASALVGLSAMTFGALAWAQSAKPSLDAILQGGDRLAIDEQLHVFGLATAVETAHDWLRIETEPVAIDYGKSRNQAQDIGKVPDGHALELLTADARYRRRGVAE